MNESELQILITAVDNASATLQGVADKLGATKKAADATSDSFRLTGDAAGTAGKLILGAVTAAAAGAVAFAVDAIKSYGDSQVAAVRLEQTIKNLASDTITTSQKLEIHTEVLKNTGAAADRLKKSIADAQFQIQQKQKQIEILNQTHDKTQTAHQNTTLKVQNLQHDIANLQGKVKDYTDQLSETKNKIEKVTVAHQVATAGLDDWQKKVASAEAAGIALGFADQETDDAINKLLIHTKDLSLATELNGVAMDLARSKQIDLGTAANLVGLAFEGQGRMLLQYGIHIKDTSSGLDAIKELQGQISGQATAFAATMPGQMAVVDAAWQALKDMIGKALWDALQPFVKQFTQWLMDPATKQSFAIWSENLNEWATVTIPVLIDTFNNWVSVLKTIFEWLTKIGDAILSVQKMMEDSFTGKGGLGGFLQGQVNTLTALLNKAAQPFIGGGGGGSGGGGTYTLGPGGIPVGTSGFGSTAPHLAAGGIVTGPTFALIGESGPEAVIPLNDANRQMGGITVNINGGTYLSEDVANKIGNMLIHRLQRISRLSVQ